MKWFIGFYLFLCSSLAFMAWGLPAMGVSREAQVEWAEQANSDVQDGNAWMMEKTFVPVAQLISPHRNLRDLAVFLMFVVVGGYAGVRSYFFVFMGGGPSPTHLKEKRKSAVALLLFVYVAYGFYLFAIH